MKKFFGLLFVAVVAVGAIAESRAYDDHHERAREDKVVRALRMATVTSASNSHATLLRLDGGTETVVQDYHSPLYAGGVYNLTLRDMSDGATYASKKRLLYLEESHKLCADDVLDYDPRIAKVCN